MYHFSMFLPDDRIRLRSELLDRASADPDIVAAALTGSAAEGKEDRWSDIDLAFAVRNEVEVQSVLSAWTKWLYGSHGALHHYDLAFRLWLYRVFLLPNTLQVDLAFVPAAEFRPLGPTFQVVFGEPREAQYQPAPEASSCIGLGWLYALHARSAIARSRAWQAEYMINGIRQTALTLACLRTGLPTAHARGIDRLPPELLRTVALALVRDLSTPELERAFRAALTVLVAELRRADATLADRLQPALEIVVRSETER